MNKLNLGVMDIYPDMLRDNYELCEEILKDYGYTENDFFKLFDQELTEFDLQNLSNRIVGIMFDITKELINKKDPKAEVDYYINGSLNTHFYINGEQQ